MPHLRFARKQLTFAGVAMTFVATAFGVGRVNCPTINERLYFQDGVDHDDGMVADLDFAHNVLRVADQQYAISNCRGSGGVICFKSDYFTFSSGPRGNKVSWEINGYVFRVSPEKCNPGRCKNSGNDSYIILSTQKKKMIEFYYSDRCGLLGWKVTYPPENGEIYVDTFYVAGKGDGGS